ncbi:SepM family pheromone-processing serine protease [Paenactinomyces guangxiensis]|uniref:endopeptidase La n=1 Tax=Paenactinomyces guangxiensis TaxID=1490290 RepID=A0A7W1WRI2_9BACL|nr:SepM family pheromone-processing serine protease [Paenactinomyces guangxiensis]MBA4494742.1 PDZ domain-containing protein [Paenactinomyces guangxiensis]MBH8591826.1 PDZ domain-containing protein [Paenactinomyces guangxiensis]
MNFRRWSKQVIGGFIASVVLIVIGATLLIPVPYFVLQPGVAIDVKPLVKVDKETAGEKGTFLLTTISLKEGNVFDYLYAKGSGRVELVPEQQILAENESEEEYQRRQAENMIASQHNAIIAAYREARRPVSVEILGIEVFQLVNNQPHVLQKGDLIKKVDQKLFSSTEKLIQYLSRKKPGDVVTVDLIRNGKRMEKKVKLVALPVSPGQKKRAGLGIVPVPRVEVKTSPPASIETENIGGPSAGLMFSLEVLNQLIPEDLTRGYRIAGTGTISEKGEVGQIGGIQHKIVAAEREEAQIFFCPKDRGPQDTNERMAKETARRIGSKMKIIPVSSLKEAVRYLRTLPVHQAAASFKVKTLT